MMKKIVACLWFMVSIILAGCSHHQKISDHVITVGVLEGPEAELMEVVKKIAMKKFELEVRIVSFKDYNAPNEALERGDIDANSFQYAPFLTDQMDKRGYSLVAVGNTFLYPMGLYSNAVNQLSNLTPGSEIAIPDNPEELSRALLLLQAAGLIALKPTRAEDITMDTIIGNPNRYKIIPIDSAALPAALKNTPLVAINRNDAIAAGLSPSRDALFFETSNSNYMNLIVVRKEDKDDPTVRKFVDSYQSEPVAQKAKEIFGSDVIPGF